MAPDPPDADVVSPESFRASFGEELHRILDLDTWHTDRDLSGEFARIEAEVRWAVARETEVQADIRMHVFPRLAWAPGAPKGAGVYAVPLDELRAVQDGLLFRGGVECCDGTSQVCD